MRSFYTSLTLTLITAISPEMVKAADGPRIGIVAPMSGEYALLGQQILSGAGLQVQQSGIAIAIVDEPCEDGSGTAVADALIDAKIDIALGFLCGDTLRGALPALKTSNIPAITLSVRSMPLMADAMKEGWPLYRMAPNSQDQIDTIVDVILRDWADKPIALIDDGTIHYRELVNAIRNALEERGLPPTFVDSFRPAQEQQLSLVRRLAQVGTTHVFIGGSRNDIAIIARDAKQHNVEITFMGGDSLNAAETDIPLENGVLAVTLPAYNLFPSAASITERARDAGIAPEGYVLSAAAAIQLASEALNASNGDPVQLAEKLMMMKFDTGIGPISFTKNHELTQNPFRLHRWQNGKFVLVLD